MILKTGTWFWHWDITDISTWANNVEILLLKFHASYWNHSHSEERFGSPDLSIQCSCPQNTFKASKTSSSFLNSPGQFPFCSSFRLLSMYIPDQTEEGKCHLNSLYLPFPDENGINSHRDYNPYSFKHFFFAYWLLRSDIFRTSITVL